jgi:two-component system sensor histidine kinase/response regulator
MMNPSIPLVPSAVQDPAERRRQLFEEAPVAYHEIDTEGIIREVNHTECVLLGYTPHELLGHHIWEFVAAEQQEAARQAIAQKMARQQPLTVVTREYRRSDGSYIWLEIHERLIEAGDGAVVGIRSALLDITERHEFDAEIQRQNDWMRLVLRSVATAIVTADALGNIDFMNPSAETITGWEQQDALGRPLEEICRVHHDPGEPVDLMSCILAESVVSNPSRKFVLLDRSGGRHSVGWMISALCNDSGFVIGAVIVIEKRRTGES